MDKHESASRLADRHMAMLGRKKLCNYIKFGAAVIAGLYILGSCGCEARQADERPGALENMIDYSR